MYEILVVEDNDELRNIIKEALTSEGYSVFITSSAEEAFEIIKEKFTGQDGKGYFLIKEFPGRVTLPGKRFKKQGCSKKEGVYLA